MWLVILTILVCTIILSIVVAKPNFTITINGESVRSTQMFLRKYAPYIILNASIWLIAIAVGMLNGGAAGVILSLGVAYLIYSSIYLLTRVN